MPGLITEFLGEGLAASRPATPDIPSGAIAFYRATDTDELSVYAEGAWIEDILSSGGAGFLQAANNLSDVGSATTSRTNLGVGTGDSPQFTAINVGHASDTTIARVSAGVVAVEGNNVVTTAGGVTFAADISVPADAYDATNWNGNNEVPTKNDIRDKIESLGSGGAWEHVETVSPSGVTSIDSEAFAGAGYKSLWFVIDLSFATDQDNLAILFKLNGGYKNTNYRYSGQIVSSGAGSLNAPASNVGTSGAISSSGATWGIGNQAVEGYSGDLLIRNASSSRPKRYHADIEYGLPSGSSVGGFVGGVYDGTDYGSALAGVRFAATGNITGTIEVWGLA